MVNHLENLDEAILEVDLSKIFSVGFVAWAEGVDEQPTRSFTSQAEFEGIKSGPFGFEANRLV